IAESICSPSSPVCEMATMHVAKSRVAAGHHSLPGTTFPNLEKSHRDGGRISKDLIWASSKVAAAETSALIYSPGLLGGLGQPLLESKSSLLDAPTGDG